MVTVEQTRTYIVRMGVLLATTKLQAIASCFLNARWCKVFANVVRKPKFMSRASFSYKFVSFCTGKLEGCETIIFESENLSNPLRRAQMFARIMTLKTKLQQIQMMQYQKVCLHTQLQSTHPFSTRYINLLWL